MLSNHLSFQLNRSQIVVFSSILNTLSFTGIVSSNETAVYGDIAEMSFDSAIVILKYLYNFHVCFPFTSEHYILTYYV